MLFLLLESCIQQWKATSLLTIPISLACARASKLTTKKHIYRQSHITIASWGWGWGGCGCLFPLRNLLILDFCVFRLTFHIHNIRRVYLFLFESSPYMRKLLQGGLILGFRPANERRRYFVTTSLIGWAQPRIGITISSAHKKSKRLIKPTDTPAPSILRCCSRSLIYNETKKVINFVELLVQ